jgi:hypothetical protein
MTLFGLFGEDIKQAFFHKSADEIFTNITMFCIFTMALEITLNTIIDPSYCGSFFFYLAIICKLTMFIDIDPIKNFVFLGGGKDVARAGKATRLGTKASKVVRVIRLIRLIRIAKFYKQQQAKENEEDL